jgi:PPM family protein phosphatase
MNFHIKAISDKGMVRTKNEDKILIPGKIFTDDCIEMNYNTESVTAFAVADGMGGHKGGEVASNITLERLQDFISALPGDLIKGELKDLFNKWAVETALILKEKGTIDPSLYNMGTTLTGILFYYGDFYWFNAGDSRVYSFSKGCFSQLTTDHSSIVDMGYYCVSTNLLTNSIGGGAKSFIDMEKIRLFPPEIDHFLICSDGLTNMVDIAATRELIEHMDTEGLVRLANSKGGRDNISLILIQIQV